MKKCPPGVLCIENFTLFFIFIFFFITIYFFIKTNNQNNQPKQQEVVINYPKHTTDVLMNPYDPPYKNETYLKLQPSVPINVSTNVGAVDTTYRQVGIMTPLNGTSKDNILPLMGRPLFTNRDKWQYYTISNQHNNVKLPISFKGKSALNDYGVDKIYSGDTVYVEGYNEPFAVTVYENDTIKYLPFV